ncbi:Alpha-L-fucosidase [Planctomycetes bacterium CA13]|uniref:alpha-L-fucosidase n=1 Tax=Novipirellula herctigrandis TaxID=2527986 RepID=A0A5C5ZA55_9BACT|nr:Alpha-L-fucosidase [Planctomycetes bacterium CA13]
MGPKKDTMRMLADATRAAGLKFAASSHFATARGFYSKKDRAFDTNNPEFQDLYMKPKKSKDELPSQDFLDLWWTRTTDIIDQSAPDLLWFDFGIDKPGYEEMHPKILAYFYNKGLEWKKEVVFQDKNMNRESVPEGLMVLDIERGRMDKINKYPWQTDTATGKNAWSYIERVEFKTSGSLLDELIDTVSKNGCLLLNVGPKSDGTIREEETAI